MTIPQKYLTPLIAVLAFIGVYSVVSNPFDLYMIIGLGVFGWILRKLGFSLAPVILGVVLGNLFEDNLRRALSISGGDWMILLESQRSIVIYVLTVLILVAPPLVGRIRRTMSSDSFEAKVDNFSRAGCNWQKAETYHDEKHDAGSSYQ